MTPLTAGLIAVVLIALGTYFAFTKSNPFAGPLRLNAVFENTNRLANRLAGADRRRGGRARS